MSYEIPELITGVPLFVPTANDFFSIEPGGLPNGDDCLVVHGDVSRDYKAFQPAQSLSPNVFLTRSATFSISFWINAGLITHDAGWRGDQVIMAVMNANMNTPSNLPQSLGSGMGDQGYGQSPWLIVAHGSATGSNCRIGMVKATHQYSFGSSGRVLEVSAPLPQNQWAFVVFQLSGLSTSIDCYVNLTQYAGSTSGGSGSQIGVAGNQYFCIGSYSDQPNMNGRDGEYRLGKLAFHNHLLSTTERSMLYYSMLNS